MIQLDEQQFSRILEPLGTGEDSIGRPLLDEDRDNPLHKLRAVYLDAIDLERQADRCRVSGSSSEQQRMPSLLKQSQERWHEVVRVGMELLATVTKAWEPVAHVVQGLTRTNCVEGLTFGYRLATGLSERYWDSYVARWGKQLGEELGILSNLNETLVIPLRSAPVTASGTPFWMAERLFGLRQERASLTADEAWATRLRSLNLTPSEYDVFFDSVEKSTGEFFQGRVAVVESAMAALSHFSRVVGAKIESDEIDAATPAISGIDTVLKSVLALLRSIAGDKLPSADAAPVVAPVDVPGDARPAESVVVGPVRLGEPRDRAEALRLVEMIADFLERTEPHSLLPAQLRRVCRHGRMSAEAFFAEIVEDPTSRLQIYKLMGIDVKQTQ